MYFKSILSVLRMFFGGLEFAEKFSLLSGEPLRLVIP